MPAVLEGQWYIGRKIRQIWAELAVYTRWHLQIGWSQRFSFWWLYMPREPIYSNQLFKLSVHFICWYHHCNEGWFCFWKLHQRYQDLRFWKDFLVYNPGIHHIIHNFSLIPFFVRKINWIEPKDWTHFFQEKKYVINMHKCNKMVMSPFDKKNPHKFNNLCELSQLLTLQKNFIFIIGSFFKGYFEQNVWSQVHNTVCMKN